VIKNGFPKCNLAESSGTGSDGVVFTADSNGFTVTGTGGNINANNATYIYVAIAAPVVASMTAEQFTEAQLKFATFENRSMVKCGNDAEARRDNLIIGLEEQGYSLTEILKYL
jgi:flagellar basal body rod protein FlgG